jgi:hypothetical protein
VIKNWLKNKWLWFCLNIIHGTKKYLNKIIS